MPNYYTMPIDAFNPGLCPACGQANQCAMTQAHSTGETPARCWCMDTRIDPAAVARLPLEQRGKACLCPACGSPHALKSVRA